MVSPVTPSSTAGPSALSGSSTGLLTAVYGGSARRWCRRFRSIALTSSIVYVVASELPFFGLIDKGLGFPVLKLMVAGAFIFLLPSTCLYLVSLIILQAAIQRQL